MLGKPIMLYPIFSKRPKFMGPLFIAMLSAGLIAACSNETPTELSGQASESSKASTQQITEAEGVIARVGGETITFNQLNTMLNSSAMVGLSLPALGTPRRNKVLITLLDKVISANLLYLDAKKKGTDKQTAYLTSMKEFEDGVLINMYKSKVLIGKIPLQ